MTTLTTTTAQEILRQFDADSLHLDLSPVDRLALATQIAQLESLGHVVDLVTCKVLPVDLDSPIEVQP